MRAACAALLALLASSAALAQYNLALNKPFTCTSEILSSWTGLVDGIKDSDSGPGCFATSNNPQFPKYLVIDLQLPCIVSRIAVYNSANGNTREVTLAVSADGESYEVLRDYIFPAGQALTLNHSFEARPRRAQFVRIGLMNSAGGGLGGDNCIFLREVEVYGVPTGGRPVAPPPVATGEPLLTSRSVQIFRRYCLAAERDCRLFVIGDSFAAEGETLWTGLLLAQLRARRPAAARTEMVVLSQEGLTPGQAWGPILSEVVAEAPDAVLLTFGSDLRAWDERQFRRDLGKLTRDLLDETGGLVILVAPPPMQESEPGAPKPASAIRRQAARELEALARLLSVPMLRTETALRVTGTPIAELCQGAGGLLPAGHWVVAERLMDLMMQP